MTTTTLEIKVHDFLARGLPDEGIEQHVRDVVRQRAPDQELHREVVSPLRILPVVSCLRPHPPLRQHVTHRPRDGLEAIAGAGGLRVDHVVEEQVPVIQTVVRSRELDRAASVLPQ